jgi:hypothetical protein
VNLLSFWRGEWCLKMRAASFRLGNLPSDFLRPPQSAN